MGSPLKHRCSDFYAFLSHTCSNIRTSGTDSGIGQLAWAARVWQATSSGYFRRLVQTVSSLRGYFNYATQLDSLRQPPLSVCAAPVSNFIFEQFIKFNDFRSADS